MTRQEIMKELGSISKRIFAVECKLSDFTDMLNAQRKAETSENQEAILDEAEVIDENSEAAIDLAEMIGDIEERLSVLEGE